MTVDNDFKWKKPGLTSMQEKKNLDILNDCSGNTSKIIRPNYGLFFPSLLSRNHINHTKDTVGVTYGHSFLV